MNVSAVLAILRQTPLTVGALLDGLPEDLLGANEGPDTFSPRDVVGHLVFGEETDWVPRIRIILEHGPRRPFTPFDRTGFRAAYAGVGTAELLDRFASLRGSNLAFVRDFHLTPEKLALPGTHPELGAVTLGQLLSTWAVHDLGHVTQISRVLAKQYRDEVGPWRAYLSILDK
jgi:DinB superfamily